MHVWVMLMYVENKTNLQIHCFTYFAYTNYNQHLKGNMLGFGAG